MSSRKEHCQDCIDKLGKPFEEVHKWLDEKSCYNGKLNINHRRYRHHNEGVEQIRNMYGDDAAKAAELHIILDFGYIPTKEEIEDFYPDELDLISFNSLNK